jgi:hypothetical protein
VQRSQYEVPAPLATTDEAKVLGRAAEELDTLLMLLSPASAWYPVLNHWVDLLDAGAEGAEGLPECAGPREDALLRLAAHAERKAAEATDPEDRDYFARRAADFAQVGDTPSP